MNFLDIYHHRDKYKAKIRSLPKSKLSKYKDFIKLLLLSDEELIDSLTASYFKNVLKIKSPIKPKGKLPKSFIPEFENEKEFFYFVSDELKKLI